jgi:hypothetical protein
MRPSTVSIGLVALLTIGCAAPESETAPQDAAVLEAMLEDIRVGGEQGAGDPFYSHFLDWEGARYFEGGGENLGLRDLVENHVEPEAELGLRLGFSNVQTHRGHGTYLFRWTDGEWRVVHTQSASSPVRDGSAG